MDTVRQGDAATANLASLVPETDWRDLAPAAGGIGRFVYEPATDLCEIDATSRRMTGLLSMVAPGPASAFFDRIVPEDRAGVERAVKHAMDTGAPYEVEFRFRRDDGTELWIAGQGRRLPTGDGRDILIGVNLDVTERRRAQERAELLSREMAHRMKNVFALVQGMFNMAARSAPSREALADGFAGRLRALAAVNALTFAGEDRSVEVASLVDAVLGPLIAAGRIEAATDDFTLNGAAAQTVVLVLNELMTNAVKYGALRDGAGDGRVAFSIVAGGGDFELRWEESGAGPTTPPKGRGGFGMQVLRSMTAATFDGHPTFDWGADGLRFRCWWPRAEFSAGNPAEMAQHAPV